MALSASVIYEVRPGAGSDTNGGGFDPSVASPGTDFSQQNSPQHSGTDGVATGTAAFTAASHSFVSADVGNLLNISAGSGFTTGLYTIVSVSSGTATLDRSPGTGTGATWKEGGASASLVSPIGFGTTYTSTPITAYVKGTLTVTSALNLTTVSLILIGYGSVRGDSGQATVTTATNSTALANLNGTATLAFSNFILSNTATTRAAVLTNSSAFYTVNLQFTNCLINGVSTVVNFASSITVEPIIFLNTEIKNTTGAAITGGGSGVPYTIIFLASFVHSCSSDAIFPNTSGGCYLFVKDSVIASNSGIGVRLTSGTHRTFILDSMFYANSNDGIQLFTGAGFTAFVVMNNIFYGQTGGFGINRMTANAIPILTVSTNAFGGNSSGAHTGIPTSGDVTLSGDPTFSGSTGNFQLNNNAGQGSACKRTAFQSTLVG